MCLRVVSFLLILSSVSLIQSGKISIEICSGINIVTNFIRGIDEVRVLKYELDLKVAVGERRGLNKIALGNEKSTSLNHSLYTVSGPPQFWDDQGDTVIKCPSNFNECIFEILDGGGNLELPVWLNGEFGDPVILMDVMFDDGTVFQAPYGQLFVGDSKCFQSQTAVTALPDYIQDIHVCCNNFQTLNIPINEDQCVEFSSSTTLVLDQATQQSAQLSATYIVQESVIQIRINSFTGPQGAEFYLQPNENAVTCSFSNFNCTQPILDNLDFQFDFEAYVHLNYKRKGATVGKLARRNGVFLKHDSPYTRLSPCWSRSVSGKWKSKFCCSKFAQPSTDQRCANYESRTRLTNDSMLLGYFQSRYSFDVKHLNLQILNFTSIKDGNAMFYYYNNGWLVQDCIVTTTLPQKACQMELNLDKAYEFLLKTSFAPDGFTLFNGIEDDGQFKEPSLNPVNTCIQYENPGLYPVPKMLAKTEICCIATENAPWPGTF